MPQREVTCIGIFLVGSPEKIPMLLFGETEYAVWGAKHVMAGCGGYGSPTTLRRSEESEDADIEDVLGVG